MKKLLIHAATPKKTTDLGQNTNMNVAFENSALSQCLAELGRTPRRDPGVRILMVGYQNPSSAHPSKHAANQQNQPGTNVRTASNRQRKNIQQITKFSNLLLLRCPDKIERDLRDRQNERDPLDPNNPGQCDGTS